jgi:hypothetical protein
LRLVSILCAVSITKHVVVRSTWYHVQNGSTMSCQYILHVQSCQSDNWLPSYSRWLGCVVGGVVR